MSNHPLPLNTNVEVKMPVCACTGSNFKIVTGTIQKVMTSGGIWYYLSSGVTVKAEWVQRTI